MSAAPETTRLRLAGLDGLRGVACLMVFLYHLRWHAQPSVEHPLRLEIFGFDLERLLARFDAGVAIFFVLSGLLLSLPFWRAIQQLGPAPDPKRYFWRRVCRIVPAYYAVLIAVYLLRPGTYTLFGAIDFLLHATFLHNFSDESYYGVYPLLWTIGIEFQFYLVLPLIMTAMAWCYRRAGAGVAIALLFAVTWLMDAGARAALGHLAPAIPDRFLADHESAVVPGTIFSYLKLFAFGIAGGWVVLRWNPRPIIADLLASVALIGFLLLLGAGHEAGWRETSATGWPFNALVIGVLVVSVVKSRYFAGALSLRPVVAFGTISYGVYLWHELVQRAVFGGTLPNHFQSVPLFLAGGLIAFAATMAIAALSWRHLERPALQRPYPFGR
jgi:peptidoglycan/LPS O-acetylase OafA/YrhL